MYQSKTLFLFTGLPVHAPIEITISGICHNLSSQLFRHTAESIRRRGREYECTVLLERLCWKNPGFTMSRVKHNFNIC